MCEDENIPDSSGQVCPTASPLELISTGVYQIVIKGIIKGARDSIVGVGQDMLIKGTSGGILGTFPDVFNRFDDLDKRTLLADNFSIENRIIQDWIIDDYEEDPRQFGGSSHWLRNPAQLANYVQRKKREEFYNNYDRPLPGEPGNQDGYIVDWKEFFPYVDGKTPHGTSNNGTLGNLGTPNDPHAHG